MQVKISIILPTSRSAKIANETLNSISEAALADDVEVLVVENGAKNEIFKNTAVSLGFRYFHEPVEGLLAGRHLGTHKANGDIVVFIDDDVILSTTWITGVRHTFRDENVHLATGPCLPKYLGQKPDWLDSFWINIDPAGRALFQLSLFELKPCLHEICPTSVWGLNFGIRKKTLLNLGGFHPDGVSWELRKFRGDGEIGLAHKAKEQKLIAMYNPQMALEHIVPKNRMTISYFEKRAYLEGITTSYALKREENIQDEKSTFLKSDSIPYHPVWKKFITKIIRVSLSLVKSKQNATDPIDSNLNLSIQDRIDLKHHEGYKYHREQMKMDPLLEKWVLKEDYWDYAYPLKRFKEP